LSGTFAGLTLRINGLWQPLLMPCICPEVEQSSMLAPVKTKKKALFAEKKAFFFVFTYLSMDYGNTVF
jgi:hypothetical protein